MYPGIRAGVGRVYGPVSGGYQDVCLAGTGTSVWRVYGPVFGGYGDGCWEGMGTGVEISGMEITCGVSSPQYQGITTAEYNKNVEMTRT
jgi:hypothetical protein